MAELLHIYMNNPTEGGKDGTEVSSGTELAPISGFARCGQGRAESRQVCRALRERLPYRRNTYGKVRRRSCGQVEGGGWITIIRLIPF